LQPALLAELIERIGKRAGGDVEFDGRGCCAGCEAQRAEREERPRNRANP